MEKEGSMITDWLHQYGDPKIERDILNNIDPQIIANRKSIAGGEERVKSYKDLLTEVFKHKDLYPEWYKDFLREIKNYEEKRLKELREENEYLKAGMNPPMKNIPSKKRYPIMLHYQCATCGNHCLQETRPDNTVCGGCDCGYNECIDY